MMRIDVFSVFPTLVDDFCSGSLLGKARENDVVNLAVHDLRDYTHDVHRTIDDAPYGGGAGMLMRPEPIFEAVEAVQPARPLFLLGPGGKKFDQDAARYLATLPGFSLICGRYEGVDHRVRQNLIDGEISIGDVVLAGGEVAACVVIEAVTRLLPGVMGNSQSPLTESFDDRGLLEEPQFTRPIEFDGISVPDILRSGDHAAIARWRLAQALWHTQTWRPDLIAARGGLTPDEQALLEAVVPLSYPLPFAFRAATSSELSGTHSHESPTKETP